MIRVTITGPPTQGRFPYRVDTENTRLAKPLVGLASQPIYDACYRLSKLGAANSDAVVALIENGKIWRQTTVGYGADYMTFPALNRSIDATPATPSTESPPPHKSPELLTDTGPGPAAPNTSGKSRRRRSGVGSSARRGSR